MNDKDLLAKVERGEGLTVEEVVRFQQLVKPVKHTYGKYGALAKQFLEEHRIGELLAMTDVPAFLHGIDRQADEMYEYLYEKLSKSERFKRTGDFLTDLRRQTELQHEIEQEILNELIYSL